MKDYYRILNVGRAASSTEVRNAYRKLVQRLHPDVNPSPAAHELIKEVNEAYAVLGDEAKRRDYDYRFDNPDTTVFVPPEPVHRDPAYRRRGASRPPAQESSQQDLMRSYLPYVSKVCWVGFFLCGLLIVDFYLPNKIRSETISAFQYKGYSRTKVPHLITQSNLDFKVSDRDIRFFSAGQQIEIVESKLFSVLVEIRIPETHQSVTNLGTVYSNFIFAPLLLLVLSTLGILIKKNVEFQFNLSIATLFVLIFTIIFLI